MMKQFITKVQSLLDGATAYDVPPARLGGNRQEHLQYECDGRKFELVTKCVDIYTEWGNFTAILPCQWLLPRDKKKPPSYLDLALSHFHATKRDSMVVSLEMPYVNRDGETKTTRYFMGFQEVENGLRLMNTYDCHGFEYTLLKGARYCLFDIEMEGELEGTEAEILGAVFTVMSKLLPRIGEKFDWDKIGILRATRGQK